MNWVTERSRSHQNGKNYDKEYQSLCIQSHGGV